INPKTAGWTYLSFRTVRCRADDVLAGETGADETALIWLGGRADVDGFGEVGEREDVFTGLPSAIVLPPQTAYRMRARSPLHLAIVSAPAEAAPAARLIRPGDVRVGGLPSMSPSAPAMMISSWSLVAITWSPPRRDTTATT